MNPLECGYRCHEIGGPWIAENPECPIHGTQSQDFDADRAKVLLKAALELLKSCGEGPYVKNALTVEVFYDGTMCDGGCLANDIADLLGEEEVF